MQKRRKSSTFDRGKEGKKKGERSAFCTQGKKRSGDKLLRQWNPPLKKGEAKKRVFLLTFASTGGGRVSRPEVERGKGEEYPFPLRMQKGKWWRKEGGRERRPPRRATIEERGVTLSIKEKKKKGILAHGG